MDYDRSRRIRSVPNDDRNVEVSVRVRLPRAIKIAGFLLAAAGGPVAILGGILPWGMRLAGVATSADLVTLKADITKIGENRQIDNDVDAKKAVVLTNEMEAIRSSISLLGDKVKSLGFKINRRTKAAE